MSECDSVGSPADLRHHALEGAPVLEFVRLVACDLAPHHAAESHRELVVGRARAEQVAQAWRAIAGQAGPKVSISL